MKRPVISSALLLPAALFIGASGCHPTLITDPCIKTDLIGACNEDPGEISLARPVVDWVGLRKTRVLASLKIDRPAELECDVSARQGEVDLAVYSNQHGVACTTLRNKAHKQVRCRIPIASTYQVTVTPVHPDVFTLFGYVCSAAPLETVVAAPVQLPPSPEVAVRVAPQPHRGRAHAPASERPTRAVANPTDEAPGSHRESEVKVHAKVMSVQKAQGEKQLVLQLDQCDGLGAATQGSFTLAGQESVHGSFTVKARDYCDLMITLSASSQKEHVRAGREITLSVRS